MVSNLAKSCLTGLHRRLMYTSPLFYQNFVRNFINYKNIPIWPRILLPRAAPYFLHRDNVSIKKCKKIYKSINNINHLRDNKDSDTLAVLGSGSSIKELNEEDFDYISTVDSIALNNWGIYHDFVPDFYKFELCVSDHDEWISKINKKSADYSETIFIYEPENMFSAGQNATETLLQLDKQIRKDLVDIRIFKYHHPHNKGFNDNLIKLFFPTIGGRICHFRGSLSQVIALAYILDYDNILLYGIDLANPEHFFNSSNDSSNDNKEGKYHPTAQTQFNLKGIHEYIKYINDNIFNPVGKNMYVASENSLLYPQLDHIRKFIE